MVLLRLRLSIQLTSRHQATLGLQLQRHWDAGVRQTISLALSFFGMMPKAWKDG
ncbi:MAG: hypothetical protein ACI83N_001912 [Hydrogenophaga sp.]|jgi:hypothetical protein